MTTTGLMKSSFNMNLLTLRFLGLYPRKKHSQLYIIYGYVLLFCSLLPDPLFGVLYYLRDEELGLLDGGLDLILMMAMLSFIPKMLPVIINHEEIRHCLYYLELVLNAPQNAKQKDITNDCVWICRRNFRFFLFCIVLNDMLLTIEPLLSPQRKFPMELWLPFDPTTNYVNFYCVYFVSAMGITYTVLSSGAVDTLVSGLTYHAAGQVKILKDNLEFLLEYAEACGKNEMKYQIIYQKIRECSHHHQHIICFVKQIEKCFTWVVFSQLFGSIVMICLCCLQLSQMEPGSFNFLLLAYPNAALIEIYFYCYYGTTLYEESKTLVTAAYLGRWYEYDLKSQKALVLFMERAKIPMTVTAGKMFDVSLQTFTNVLKKSYSLLAVLQNY